MGVELIASLMVLAVLGIFDSGYIILSRIKKKPTACPIGGHCDEVLDSKWNSFFGIVKNDVLGLSYYILILVSAIYLFFFSDKFLLIIQIIAGASLIFSFVLVFIQAKIIKEYCFYCLVSALINLLIFVNVLIL